MTSEFKLARRHVGCYHVAMKYGGQKEGTDGRARDPIKPWFQASEDLGDFVGIRFGRLASGMSEPEWFYRSHADYDGIGGFADILRGRGARLGPLPEIPHPVEPSWRYFLESVPAYLQPRERVVWRERFPHTHPSVSTSPPEAVAWRIFSEEESSTIRRNCHSAGVTVNSYLLKRLSDAIFPSLAEGSDFLPWMIPVNLRGKVTRKRDTENHSSYVRIRVGKGDTIRDVHASVYRELAGGGHWANWLAYDALKGLPAALRRTVIKIERVTSQWVVGAFSNLGVWDDARILEGSDIDDRWLFTPPAMRFFKIAAGCITYRGHLGLALHLHPELSADPADAGRWMDAWVGSLRRDRENGSSFAE